MPEKTTFKVGLLVAAAASAISAGSAYAQAGGGVLEEVVVTARKREENLQTVPVAVTVQSARDLARQNITQPTDLARTVPGLKMVEASSSANSSMINLRGQTSSDTLIGFSQPTGMYEDNVNIPHPFGANGAFFDLQRVEVLKGPQGTLYGRNTTAGAVNIITRDADFNGVHGYVTGEAGNYKDWRVGGAVNIPIVADKLALRVAAMHWSRDGFGKSKITGQRLGEDKDDDLVRLSLNYEPSDNLRARVKYEYGRTKHNGAMLYNVSLSPIPALANNGYLSTALYINPTLYRPIVRDALTPSSPTQAASLATAVAAAKPLHDSCVGGDPYVNCLGTHVFDNLKTWHFVADISWDITENVTLRSITGAHHFANFKNGDLDAMPGQLLEIGYGIGGTAMAPNAGGLAYPTGRGFEVKNDQESTQWTQEFNLSGTLMDDRLNWLVGAFGSEDKGAGAQNNAFQTDISVVRGLDPGLGSHDGLKAQNRSWAVYSQNDFKFTDQISVTLGGRYTVERLASDLSDWIYNFQTGQFSCLGLVPTATGGWLSTRFLASNQNDPDSCAYGPGDLTEGPGRIFSRRKFHGFTYLASANFQITPDKLIYAKISKGFRGGAYGRAHDLMAEPEIAKDIELGFKGDWLDHRLRTNVAVYRTNYTNKQVSIQTCSATGLPPVGGTCPVGTGFSTIARNAAAARLKGIEGEFTFRPIEHLTLNASASALDAIFTKWDGAVSGEGAPVPNIKGVWVAGGTYGAPLWNGDFNARFDADVGPGNLGVTLDYSVRGRIPVTPITNQAQMPDTIEYKINRAVGLVNARIDYTVPDMGLEVAVFATNLTNKAWGVEGISANFTAGVGHEVMQAPRMYGITVKKTFGQE